MSRSAWRDHLSRSGASTIEILVSVAIFGVLLTVLLLVWTTSPRHAASIERATELVAAASVVAEALSADLARALPASYLPEPPADGPRLELALRTAYDPKERLPLAYRRVRYELTGGMLKRDGRPLVPLTMIAFRWNASSLTVTLSGPKPPSYTFDLPAPPATAAAPWRFAADHRAARPRD